MSSYILMHSGETYYNGKRKSNKKDFKYKTFTETSSIGLKGKSKTIKYYKEDELFHCFDGDKEFIVDREGSIDRRIKNEHMNGKWGNNKEFTGIISHSAKCQTCNKNIKDRRKKMIYIAKDDKSLYLKHHGILGQKWGKQNGPPYPLSAGDHSKAEIKEGYKKSIGGGRNENLYNRKRNKLSSPSSNTSNKITLKLSPEQTKQKKEAEEKLKRIEKRRAKLKEDLTFAAYAKDGDAYRKAIKDANQIEIDRKKALKIIGGIAIAAGIAAGAVIIYKNRDSISEIAQTGANKIKSIFNENNVKKDISTVGRLKSNNKIYRNHNQWLMDFEKLDEIRFNAISDDEYKSLDNIDRIKLSADKILTRISKVNESDLTKKAAVYVSHTKDDAIRYKETMPIFVRKSNGIGYMKNGEKMYELKIKMDKVPNISTKKEQIDAFEELIKSNPKTAANNLDTMRFGLKLSGMNTPDGNIYQDIKTNPHQAALKYFNLFSYSQVDDQNDLVKNYYSLMKNKGFDAIIDINDQGRLSESPLMFINNTMLKVLSSSTFTNVDQKDLMRFFKSLS